MPKHLPTTTLAALCATAVLGLTGCSSAAGAGASTAPGSSAAAADPSTPAAAAAAPTHVLTGTKLKALLLPAGKVPAHLTLDASGTQDTGDNFNQPSRAAVATAKACDALSTSSWMTAAGIGSVSFAQNDYTDSSGKMFAQEIDGFQGKDAKAVMTALTSVFGKCAHFRSTQNGSTVNARVSHRTLHGLGTEAVEATVSSPSWQGGATLIAVQVGNLVVTTMLNDQQSTGSADLALTKALVKRVEAAH